MTHSGKHPPDGHYIPKQEEEQLPATWTFVLMTTAVQSHHGDIYTIQYRN